MTKSNNLMAFISTLVLNKGIVDFGGILIEEFPRHNKNGIRFTTWKLICRSSSVSSSILQCFAKPVVVGGGDVERQTHVSRRKCLLHSLLQKWNTEKTIVKVYLDDFSS